MARAGTSAFRPTRRFRPCSPSRRNSTSASATCRTITASRATPECTRSSTRPRRSASSIASCSPRRCTASPSSPSRSPASCWRPPGTTTATSTASASWPKSSRASRRSCRPCPSWAAGSKALSDVLQLLLAGLATGGIYALVAVGFVLLWQTSQTINFAQGEFVMLPAFFVLAAMKFGGLSFPAAMFVGFLVSLLVLGLLFKRLVVDPVIRHGVLPLVISTIALAILMKEGVKEFYAADAQPFPAAWATTNLQVAGMVVSVQNLVIIAVAVLAVAALQYFLGGTRTGRRMQATAQNPALARVLGIPVGRMVLYTFLINAGLVALASFLVSPIYLAKFTNGETLGLVAFVAAIVGGFNQVRGAIAGGLLLGVVDNFVAAYLSAQYRAAIPLFLLIAVILWRPQGLLGRVEERTV